MSAFGPKRTWAGALHMSACGGKADMPLASRNAANDPKRILPWRESEDLHRIEHRREPSERATCSDAVKAGSRRRVAPRRAKCRPHRDRLTTRQNNLID